MQPKTAFLMLDVESIGLHGPAISYGYAVMTTTGTLLNSGGAHVDFHNMEFDDKIGHQWALDHITIDTRSICYPTLQEFRASFWDVWKCWRSQVYLFGDVIWPVESNFLSAMIADDFRGREWGGPYPILDLASIRAAYGFDPAGDVEREPLHLPAHNAVRDARHSARVLQETLEENGLSGGFKWG